jgi:hypothetical protein
MIRLAEAIDLLAADKPMPPINRAHSLVGNFKAPLVAYSGKIQRLSNPGIVSPRWIFQ